MKKKYDYENQYTISLLEGIKRKTDVMADVFPENFKWKKMFVDEYYVCKKCRNKLKRKPAKNSKCPHCQVPLRGRKWGGKGRGTNIINFEKTEETEEVLTPKQKGDGLWILDSNKALKRLLSDKIIIKMPELDIKKGTGHEKRLRGNYYDINFEVTIDNLIEKNLSIIPFMSSTIRKEYDIDVSNISDLKKLLAEILKKNEVRSDIFSFEKWKFLFSKKEGFYSPFKNLYGFINFALLIYLLNSRLEFLGEKENSFFLKNFRKRVVSKLMENEGSTYEGDLMNLKDISYKGKVMDEISEIKFDISEELMPLIGKFFALYFNFERVGRPLFYADANVFFESIEEGFTPEGILTNSKVKLTDLFYYDINERVKHLFN